MAFCAYRADKRKEVFEQLCEESLFRCVYSHLRNRVMRETSMYQPSPQYDYSLVEVWEDAKELIRSISYSKHPDIRILHELDSLPQRYTHFSQDPRGVLNFDGVFCLPIELTSQERLKIIQCVYICASCMLYFTYLQMPKDEHEATLSLCIDCIDDKIMWNTEEIDEDIRRRLKDGIIKYDYEYFRFDQETESSSDAESDGQSSDEYVWELEGKVKDLELQIEESQVLYEHIDAQDKLRMEVFSRIIEKAGVVLTKGKNGFKQGNKKKVASLMSTILKVTDRTSITYLSNRGVPDKSNEEAKIEINKLLRDIGLDIVIH